MDIEERQHEYRAALTELIEAIEKRWGGETDRKRAAAISPRMEDAIAAAKAILDGEEE